MKATTTTTTRVHEPTRCDYGSTHRALHSTMTEMTAHQASSKKKIGSALSLAGIRGRCFRPTRQQLDGCTHPVRCLGDGLGY